MISPSDQEVKSVVFNALFHVSNGVLFLITYVAVLSAYGVMNRVEFKRCPEKGERYKALPIGYKIICWFFIIPLFAATVIEGAFFIPALVSFVVIQEACVRWYRKAGFFL